MTIPVLHSDVRIAVDINRFTGAIVGRTLDVQLPVPGTFVGVKPDSKPPAVTTDD